MKKILTIIFLILLLIIIMIIIYPNINKNYYKTGKLYISEILAKNTNILADNDGDYSDYIEIYNGYNHSINLKDYYLSDDEYKPDKWRFPNIEIKSKEYLIIYASGKDECDIKKRICHTNFKLSSMGETIILLDPYKNIISKFEFNEQFSDISYGYSKGKYIYFETPTPEKENKSKEYKVISNKKYSLEITEYMTHNKRSNYDRFGNYYDWIEIYNSSSEDYVLENVYVTDNENNLRKFKLKEETLKSEEYLVIYFAGDSMTYDDGQYADFSLSDNDEYIIISNGKEIIDKVKLVKLTDDISYGKDEKNWKYYTTSTPGRANTTAGFTEIGGLNGSS